LYATKESTLNMSFGVVYNLMHIAPNNAIFSSSYKYRT
jgi:hypothetical protein